MSFSRDFTRLKIGIAVAVQRTIGRILALGKKNTNIKGKILSNYFARKYIPLLPKKFEVKKESNNLKRCSENTIWQFWDNPKGRETPEIVGACLKSVSKQKKNFDQKILNMESIDNYSDLPGFVYDRLKYGRMHFAHFSDLLRLNLLKNHGGVWMDATDYMTAPIPKYITDEDFFVFLTDKRTRFPYSFMQNFFIRAKKGSFLLNAWHDMCLEYWKNEVKDIEYFQHQLMFRALVTKNKTAKELFNKMPHVSEDPNLQFIEEELFMKFDPKKWAEIKKASFLQKLSYKDGRHSIADPEKYPDSYFSKIALSEIK